MTLQLNYFFLIILKTLYWYIFLSSLQLSFRSNGWIDVLWNFHYIGVRHSLYWLRENFTVFHHSWPYGVLVSQLRWYQKNFWLSSQSPCLLLMHCWSYPLALPISVKMKGKFWGRKLENEGRVRYIIAYRNSKKMEKTKWDFKIRLKPFHSKIIEETRYLNYRMK